MKTNLLWKKGILLFLISVLLTIVFQGRILQSSLNGDNIEDTVTGLRFPIDFALNTRLHRIYWVQADKDVGKSKSVVPTLMAQML